MRRTVAGRPLTGYTGTAMAFDPKLHADRRARVFAEMEGRGGGVMLLPAADERLRNADAEYLFRQDSDYAWTVGLDEPMGCALLVARRGERRFVLFVRPRDREKEIWNGRRVGVDGAKAEIGADEAFTVAEMDAKLGEWLEGAPTLWFSSARTPRGTPASPGPSASCAPAPAPASGRPRRSRSPAGSCTSCGS